MLRRLIVTVILTAAAGVVHAQTPDADPTPARGLAACEQPPGEGRGALTGRITDSQTALPLQEADVAVEWEERAGRRGKAEFETDEDGVFLACSLPAGTLITMTARFGRANERQGVRLASGETRTFTIELDAPRSRAAGRVVEHGSNRGIGAAELHIAGSQVRAVSGADGAFQLPDVPAGRYLLETSHLGFGTRSDTVTVEYGSIMLYTIGLAPDAIPLQPIDVAVRSVNLERRGFYDRRERGFGTYLTRRDWSGRAVHLPSELLRTVPGVRIVPRAGGFGNIVYDRGNCAFRYIVDGVRVGGTFQMDELTAESIEAVEVYRGVSQVPMEFRAPPTSARANCGVIVVWTRGAR